MCSSDLDDVDVMRFLRMMTFIPIEEIEEMDKWDDSRINERKEILARELTKLVHGEDEAKKAEAGAKTLFIGGDDIDDSLVPKAYLEDSDFTGGIEEGKIDIQQLLVSSGLNTGRGDARRAVEQGGVTVDGEKVSDVKTFYSKEDFKDGKLVRRGKKNYRKVFCK